MLLLRRYGVRITVALMLLIALFLSSLYSYLLFHSLAEVFSLIVAFGVLMIAWNTRVQMDNSYFLFIGIALGFIGLIDLLHTLAYKGMGVFSGYDANLPTQLWIAARYLQSITFFIAPLFIGKRLRSDWLLIGYSTISVIVIGAIFNNLFPICYIEGSVIRVGATEFKRIINATRNSIMLGMTIGNISS